VAGIAAGMLSPMLIWRAFAADHGKAYEKGLREGQSLAASSKGMFDPR
jgi:hypothetical protein